MKNDENQVIYRKNESLLCKKISIHFIQILCLMVTYFLIFIFTRLHHTFWVHNFSFFYMKNVVSPFQKCIMNLLFS
jgi:hypothetical protein